MQESKTKKRLQYNFWIVIVSCSLMERSIDSLLIEVLGQAPHSCWWCQTYILIDANCDCALTSSSDSCFPRTACLVYKVVILDSYDNGNQLRTKQIFRATSSEAVLYVCAHRRRLCNRVTPCQQQSSFWFTFIFIWMASNYF